MPPALIWMRLISIGFCANVYLSFRKGPAMNNKITLSQVKRIIAEEVSAAMNEENPPAPAPQPKPDTNLKTNFSVLIDLLNKIDEFDKKASPELKSSLSPHLDIIKKTLAKIKNDAENLVLGGEKKKEQGPDVSLQKTPAGGSKKVTVRQKV